MLPKNSELACVKFSNVVGKLFLVLGVSLFIASSDISHLHDNRDITKDISAIHLLSVLESLHSERNLLGHSYLKSQVSLHRILQLVTKIVSFTQHYIGDLMF